MHPPGCSPVCLLRDKWYHCRHTARACQARHVSRGLLYPPAPPHQGDSNCLSHLILPMIEGFLQTRSCQSRLSSSGLRPSRTSPCPIGRLSGLPDMLTSPPPSCTPTPCDFHCFVLGLVVLPFCQKILPLCSQLVGSWALSHSMQTNWCLSGRPDFAALSSTHLHTPTMPA